MVIVRTSSCTAAATGAYGQVQLDGAVGPVGAVVLQRHVDLEQLVLAVLAAGAVVGGVGEARDDVAVQGSAQLTRLRGLPDELGVLRVVEDRPVGVEDLQLDRVEGGQLVPAVPNCSEASSTACSTSISREAREPLGEVGPGELRLEPRRTAMRAASSACWRARSSMTVLSTEASTIPDRDRHQEADDREADQQTGASAGGGEGSCILHRTGSPVLESGRSLTPPRRGVGHSLARSARHGASGHVRPCPKRTGNDRPDQEPGLWSL